MCFRAPQPKYEREREAERLFKNSTLIRTWGKIRPMYRTAFILSRWREHSQTYCILLSQNIANMNICYHFIWIKFYSNTHFRYVCICVCVSATFREYFALCIYIYISLYRKRQVCMRLPLSLSLNYSWNYSRLVTVCLFLGILWYLRVCVCVRVCQRMNENDTLNMYIWNSNVKRTKTVEANQQSDCAICELPSVWISFSPSMACPFVAGILYTRFLFEFSSIKKLSAVQKSWMKRKSNKSIKYSGAAASKCARKLMVLVCVCVYTFNRKY